MAVPKQKTTKAKRGKRRSHHALKRANLVACPKCKKKKPSHQTCPHCGTYKNRQIVPQTKKKKRLLKEKQKAKKKAKEGKKGTK